MKLFFSTFIPLLWTIYAQNYKFFDKRDDFQMKRGNLNIVMFIKKNSKYFGGAASCAVIGCPDFPKSY